MKYVAYKVSVVLTVAGMLLCLASFLLVLVSNAIVPGSVADAVWNRSTITYKIYQNTSMFFELIFATEVVLHIIFCILFYLHSKRRGTSHARQQANKVLKTNHIALFQIITQSSLCLLPKFFYYINKFFFDSSIEWIQHYYSYYSFFLTVNVCVVSFFIVYRLLPRKRSTVIVQNPTINSNTARTVANTN
uniref:Serpentine receptor class gamma n=1 Tax=Steinernema glaseri TaxID=37863 RepID=A0A1I8A7Q4_9BILA